MTSCFILKRNAPLVSDHLCHLSGWLSCVLIECISLWSVLLCIIANYPSLCLKMQLCLLRVHLLEASLLLCEWIVCEFWALRIITNLNFNGFFASFVSDYYSEIEVHPVRCLCFEGVPFILISFCIDSGCPLTWSLFFYLHQEWFWFC